MAANYWDLDVGRIRASDLRNKLVCAHNVQRRDPHDLPWVEALLFPKRAHCRDYRIHRIYDEPEDSIGTVLRACIDKALRNARIHLEKIITCHPRLPWNAGWDKHQVASCEAFFQLVNRRLRWVNRIPSDLGWELKVAQVSRDASRWHHGHGDILDSHLSHGGVQGHEHRQGLSNA